MRRQPGHNPLHATCPPRDQLPFGRLPMFRRLILCLVLPAVLLLQTGCGPTSGGSGDVSIETTNSGDSNDQDQGGGSNIFKRASSGNIWKLPKDVLISDAEPKTRDTSKYKKLHIPMPTDGPKSLDPVRGSTVYDNRACSQVYETLLQYKYLVRPPTLEPLLLAEMPQLSDDGRTYHFKLKEGVRFQDDPCFPDGKGREVVARDVIYSWKRMADNSNSPKSWWLFKDTIAGFDEYRDVQNKADKFDYEAPVEGLTVVNDREFEVTLKEPVQRFMWILAMFQTAVVPREAVEKYGDRFVRHPVGTGPFTMAESDWEPGKQIVFKRNKNYRPEYYPNEYMPTDKEFGWQEAAGTPLPICDEVEFTMYVETQPMWLQFKSDNLDYTTVPAENYGEAFNKRTRKLRSEFADKGIVGHHVPLLDFIFRGFNMEDPLVGGYDEKHKKLRQAICLALDWEEMNEAFYNGQSVIYDGPIPPGLDGYPKDGIAPVSYMGPDVPRAKEFLAAAGYPDGKGLPPIDFYTSRGGTSQQMVEMLQRQLAKINVEINPRLVDFSTLIEAINNKKASFFSFAWSSDYPDAENNLALFYGPNESPGSNHFNYQRDDYDELYRTIRIMPPSPQRTELYVKMRDMIIEDSPFAGSMARTRVFLVQPRLKNFKPTEDFDNWVKYLDVAD
jgi:oligopeptide transport system substrate-binding protein